MLGDPGAYNYRLEPITQSGLFGSLSAITISSENGVVDEIENTIDITVPASMQNDVEIPRYPGTYQLVIDYTDPEREDVVSEAAKVVITSNAQYANLGYGILTVEQTAQPDTVSGAGACEYEIKVYKDEEEYELAGQVSIMSGGSAYPLTILEEDESNAGTANAFVTYAPSETEGEPGEARLVVSFTSESDFAKEWAITTPVASALELYSIADLPEFELISGSIADGKADLSWIVNNGSIRDIDKISVYAVTDEDYASGNEIEGVLIGTITDEEILAGGSAELELPADMPTGEYHIRAVADHSGDLMDSVTLADKYSYTNPNQPQAASSAAAVNAGDHRLRVSLEEPSDTCGGYIVNLYEVSADESGQTLYTELDNMSGASFDAGDELVVGGRYELEPDQSDPDAPTETQYVGLEPGKTYAVGVRRVNYITDDEGNRTAEVMSEETFSDGVVLSQPVTPNVSASVAASDGTAAVSISAGTVSETEVLVPTVKSADVNVTLTSDMPVSGTWYLDNISYDVAMDEAEQGGRQGIYGEFSTDEGNTAVISMTELETQQHTLHIEGTNAAGDGFSETVSFAVDTEAPTLALNAPLNGALTENDLITVSGRTEPDALLRVEVNGAVIGEKTASEWDGASDDGSFQFTVPADKGIMKNRVVITAADAVGNETEIAARTVNERISELTGVRMFFNGNDVTDTQMDSSAAANGSLEFRGVTANNETFVINDDSNLVWNLFAVEGSGRITEDGEELSLFETDSDISGGRMLFFDKNSRGMVTGMFKLTESAGFSAAASYGADGTHQITFDAPEHGHITVEPLNAAAGDTVTVTVVTGSGYVFKGWSSNSDSVSFADSSAASTTFVMPDDDVHISADIESTAAQPSPTATIDPLPTATAEPEPTATAAPTSRPGGGGGGSVSRPTAAPTALPSASEEPIAEPSQAPAETERPAWFEDVPEDKWYYDPVRYAFENGLMNGVSETLFAPESDITRAMFVTVLHRMEGATEAAEGYTFDDVSSDAYCSEAVAWASENGIVEGFSAEEFGPDISITREQMAAIIYRYARYKGYDLTASYMPGYSDAESISEYAREAVAWAADKGVMNGNDDNTFAPLANSTRAQAAAVFERIRENIR